MKTTARNSGSTTSNADLLSTPMMFSSPSDIADTSIIQIHYSSGEPSRMELIAVDMLNKKIEIIGDDADTKSTLIGFDEFNYFFFENQLVINYGSHPILKYTKSAALPSEAQPFTINFRDGSRISGKAAAAFVDNEVIHLYKLSDDKHAVRYFIPRASIDNYEIGEKIGAILISKNAVSDKDLNIGLDKQNESRNKKIGAYLEEKKIIDSGSLHIALKKQNLSPNIKIGEILVEDGHVTKEQLETALDYQKHHRDMRLGNILVKMGVTTEAQIHSCLAHKLGIPFIDLKSFKIEPTAINYVPSDIANQYQVMPVMLDDEYLVVAIPDPSRLEDIQVISFASNRKIEIVVASPADIRWAIKEYYINNLDEIETDMEISPYVEAEEIDSEMEKLANQRPIVKLVQKLLFEGLRLGASDIHIRPISRGMEILFRIHGKLVPVNHYGKSMLSPIVARIKVIARMDVASHNLPQDGRARVKFEGKVRDMRISTIPTVKGESVVIRLLANATDLKPINELGFTESDTERLEEILHRGTGILFVTGPTGSGKTTTLYSILNMLRDMELNIITVEDPVEIQVEGIEQIQVQNIVGMDFNRILRNVLRHDPDVIMIGEIRDKETAEIAIHASQTGHLVLTTLHTNSAADTILRLRDIGIDHYLLASSLLGIISQRLITKNCEHCKIVEQVAPIVRKILEIEADETFYIGKGCPACHNTGISGRLAAYEFLRISERLKEAIFDNASTADLNKIARSEGMETIVECAMKYARAGQTTLAETHKLKVG